MKQLLTALALAGSLAARAQPAPITLGGQLAICPDSSVVNVFEPIPGGLLNYFFAESPNEALVRGGRFSYRLHHAPTGLLLLTGKCTPQVWVYVEPGAQVTLAQQPGAEVAHYTFGGTNAAANDLLANGKLLNCGPPDQARVIGWLASAPTAAAVLRRLKAELRQTMQPLRAAYARRAISRTCLDYLQASTEQRLLQWAGGALLNHFTDSARVNLHLTMSRAETRQLTARLFARYDPTRPPYLLHDWGGAGYWAALVQKKLLPGPAPADPTWGQYEEQFKAVVSRVGRYDYLPPASQRLIVGGTLLNALAFKAMSPADFAAVFADYVRKFPDSPYNPVVTRYLRQEAGRVAARPAPAAPVAGVRPDFGQYALGTKSLVFGAMPGLDTVQTIGGLVRLLRPGRAVFVDFWATWCGPCVSEFTHEPALHQFLTEHDVDVLYVSIDQPVLREKWAALAAQYRLQGYHCLAPPALHKALEASIPYIPRYMLFDKSGRLLEANAPRPSEGDKLRQQVLARLKQP